MHGQTTAAVHAAMCLMLKSCVLMQHEYALCGNHHWHSSLGVEACMTDPATEKTKGGHGTSKSRKHGSEHRNAFAINQDQPNRSALACS